MLSKEIPKEKNAKIDLDQVKDYYLKRNPHSTLRETALKTRMEEFKIWQSMFSKQLPAERYNGFINLLYIFENPNATSDEIQSVLVMCAKSQSQCR